MSVVNFQQTAKTSLAHGAIYTWIDGHGFAAVLMFCLLAWAAFAGMLFAAVRFFF